jgi:hypothetical protein
MVPILEKTIGMLRNYYKTNYFIYSRFTYNRKQVELNIHHQHKIVLTSQK